MKQDTMEDRVEMVKSIFTNVGLRDWEKAMAYVPERMELEKGQRVIAALAEDEALYFRVTDYLVSTGGEGGRVSVMILKVAMDQFWQVIRSRYGFTDHGDLGIRIKDGRVVLVETPEEVEGVTRMDISELLARAGLMSGIVGRS